MSSFTQDTPHDYRILFLDMDSFFASCEQQLQPNLRGRPVGVVPQLVNSTCVLSASYEAKARGVKTGTGVAQARGLCPDIQLIEARPSLYKQIHYQISAVLQDVTPWVNPQSIDEFALTISPSERSAQSAIDIAERIKTKLARVIGPYIPASIGFASNQFLAKVASEYRKPKGLVLMTNENRHAMLSALQLTDLPGIARGLSRRLRAEGIYTTEQLLQADAQHLRRIMGFLGEVWWLRLHGYEVDDVTYARSSIGHSHVLPPAWRAPGQAYQVLQRLVHKAGQRLRREGYLATYTYLSIQYIGAGSYHGFVRSEAYADSATATKLADQLFAARPHHMAPILHLAITFSGLQSALPERLSLFDQFERPARLTKALDAINDTFGRDTIYVGSMMQARHTAPDRIPFGKVRF